MATPPKTTTTECSLAGASAAERSGTRAGKPSGPWIDTWTGGQYSLFRAFLGLSLLGHFAWLVGRSAGLMVAPTEGLSSPAIGWLVDAVGPATGEVVLLWALAAGCVLHLLVALGWKDWLSSLTLAFLWLCLLGRDPLVSAEGQLIVALLLVLHAAMPRAPYGSLAAYGRIDPRGGWRHNSTLWGIAWVVLAVGSSVAGGLLLRREDWTDGTALARLIDGPLARPGFLTDALRGLPAAITTGVTYCVLGVLLLCAPLAWIGRLRPWLWSLLLVGQLLRIALFDTPSAAPMVILLHAFTFDPAWLPAKGGKGPSTVFYDGECGLCHRFVRMLLAEDRDGDTFRFAPLKGTTFAVAVPEGPLGQLPDSVIVRTPCGDLLMHSDAALHCLRRLGGLWRLISMVVRLVPRPVRDSVYNGIAAVRKSIFAKPDNACPILPPDLQQRFMP